MKKFFWMMLFIIIGIFILLVIYFVFSQLKAIRSGSGVPFAKPFSSNNFFGQSFNNGADSVPRDVTVDDADLNGLDMSLENVKQAILDNNISLLNKFYSQPTLNHYTSSGGGRIIKTYLKDVQFSNVRKISGVKGLFGRLILI